MDRKNYISGHSADNIYWSILKTPLGEILIARDHFVIVWLSFDLDLLILQSNFNKKQIIQDEKSEIIIKILSLDNVLLSLEGTEFQKRVWLALIGPKGPKEGETISYSELAKLIGCEKSYRAVANAVGANKIALLVPCHRVICSNGSVGGYCWGVNKKIEILNYEGTKFFS